MDSVDNLSLTVVSVPMFPCLRRKEELFAYGVFLYYMICKLHYSVFTDMNF